MNVVEELLCLTETDRLPAAVNSRGRGRLQAQQMAGALITPHDNPHGLVSQSHPVGTGQKLEKQCVFRRASVA